MCTFLALVIRFMIRWLSWRRLMHMLEMDAILTPKNLQGDGDGDAEDSDSTVDEVGRGEVYSERAKLLFVGR